jgi:hypothetical protein
MSTADLERRYRRLLAWYPWSHRRVYEEEMVAVLVAGARPGQHRPTLGEATNLVASGLRYRAGATVTALAAPAWRDAAAVFGLLATLVLLSQRIVRLVDPTIADVPQYLRAVGWAAVVLAVLAGWRRPAAGLAWATTMYEAVLVARSYATDPVYAVNLLWPVVLGIAAAAALSVPAPRRHALAVLRLSRLAAFAAGLAATQTIAVVDNWRQQRVDVDLDTVRVYVAYGLEHPSGMVLTAWLAIIVLGALIAALAALTLPATVRWRVAVLAAPVVTFAAVVQLTLSGWAYSNGHLGHPIYLVPVQWTLLVGLPLVALGLGAALVHWRDQAARLTVLGRAADRERHDS